MNAVSEALMVLGFMDIIDEEDKPPETIYGDDEKLIAWFDDVKLRRKQKYGQPNETPLEEVPLMQNELTRDL